MSITHSYFMEVYVLIQEVRGHVCLCSSGGVVVLTFNGYSDKTIFNKFEGKNLQKMW